jgi:hypothetical protein
MPGFKYYKSPYFRLYSPPKSGPMPQPPAPPELVREGAVSREERFLRGDYDHFALEAIERARLLHALQDEQAGGEEPSTPVELSLDDRQPEASSD